MTHRDHVAPYNGSLSELAEDVGNLKYDALADFLRLLAEKVERDGIKDRERGRVRLASALRGCADKLGASAAEAEEAWRIAEPFMSDG